MKTKKLLVITQAVDRTDPLLGFFHRWIEILAGKYDQIEVICLRKGEHHLPENVQVHSLGKETGRSRVKYVTRFFRYIWALRHRYDSVFVHMNQEYVLLGGVMWRLLGKRITLWRNYPTGDIGTRIAVLLASQVMCTSRHSFTARFKKVRLMPVGVDLSFFSPDIAVSRTPRSILFLARMSPTKRVDWLVTALIALAREGIDFSATLVGSPPSDQVPYYERLKEKVEREGLESRIQFLPAVSNDETPALYRTHSLFVNTSPSGMYDKTLFEAAGCGCRVLTSSKDFAELAGAQAYFDSAETLAARLRETLSLAPLNEIPAYIQKHGLRHLGEELSSTL